MSFQSLLSWISSSASLSAATGRSPPPRCFNPCCHGSALQPRESDPQIGEPPADVSILVVMDQLFSPGAAQVQHRTSPSRTVSILVVMDQLFSPRHQGVEVAGTLHGTLTQVSILVVMDQLFSLHAHNNGGSDDVTFQSLLSWISSSAISSMISSASSGSSWARFQSLLSWISSSACRSEFWGW